MVRLHQPSLEQKQLQQFEQIFYKPQPEFHEATLKFEGDLNDLYQLIINHCGYQYREEQLYMAQVVFDQLMHNDKALIEANTGSGKSLAYLIAALMYYIETGEHVMISTNTKMLQNQLLSHDIPMLNDALNSTINATLIKSKQDYISLGLISQVLKDETSNYDVNLLKMQLLIWILETHTGDIEELNLRGGQKMYFEQKLKLMCRFVKIFIIITTYGRMLRKFKLVLQITHIYYILHQTIRSINCLIIVSSMKPIDCLIMRLIVPCVLLAIQTLNIN